MVVGPGMSGEPLLTDISVLAPAFLSYCLQNVAPPSHISLESERGARVGGLFVLSVLPGDHIFTVNVNGVRRTDESGGEKVLKGNCHPVPFSYTTQKNDAWFSKSVLRSSRKSHLDVSISVYQSDTDCR